MANCPLHISSPLEDIRNQATLRQLIQVTGSSVASVIHSTQEQIWSILTLSSRGCTSLVYVIVENQ
eukprot:c24020_g2_i1 orf=75-272(+)